MIGDPFPKQRKVSKGVSKQRKTEARPLLRRAPRGKPFAVGNNFGIETRFKEGNRANPGGRPKSKIISDACRAVVSSDLTERVRPQTRAEKVATKLFGMAEKGNISAIRELADRCEGRPAQSINVEDGRPDNLSVFCETVKQMYHAQHPQLVAAQDGDDENEEDA